MTGMMRAIAVLIAIAAPAVPAFAQERITAPGGLSIVKPEGWSRVPPQQPVEDLRGIGYDKPEFERAVERGITPFIVLTKYPASHAGINPTITVSYHYLSGAALRSIPTEMVTDIVNAMRRDMPEVEVIDPPAIANVMGTMGAHASVAYPRKGQSRTRVEMVTETWVSMRGVYAVMLQVTYARDEAPQTIVEIDGAVRSARIDETGPPPTIFGP